MILYNGTYFVIAIFFNLLWRYCVSKNHHLLGKDVNVPEVERITAQYALGPVAYLVCMIMAWISVPAALLVNIGLAIYFLLPPTHARWVTGR